MVFFFEKGAAELHVEVRFDPETKIYSVIRRGSDGSVVSEKVLGEEPCRRMLRSMETDLERNGWRKLKPPEALA